MQFLNQATRKPISEKIAHMDQQSRKKMLGQVFTPAWVADYMAALCIKTPTDYGLEPCFGKGIFIKTIAKRLIGLNRYKKKNVSSQITGIEIDPELFKEGIGEYRKIFGKNETFENLYLGNFFDYKDKKGSYDFGIMNPPYVRQEELNSNKLPEQIKKNTIFELFKDNPLHKYISKKANLYHYFFLYLSEFIKENGKLTAITYNSWMYTKYGQLLQKYFLDNFKINYIIDFDKDVFDDALIGSCIILLEKTTGKKNENIRNNNIVQFIRLKSKAPLNELIKATESNNKACSIVHKYQMKQGKLYADNKWEKYLFLPDFHEILINSPRLVPLRQLANVWRGTEPKLSRFFIIDKKKIKDFNIQDTYTLPILKNPKVLKCIRLGKMQHNSYLLYINKEKSSLKENKANKGILRYLSTIENELSKNDEGRKTLERTMGKDKKDWYITKLKDKGDIVFSYIIRERKVFYLNDSNIATTDNFHNLTPLVDKHALLAILNSSLTRYFLELSGRTQGGGLLKIQVYELKELLVPNIENIDSYALNKLSLVGKELSELDDLSLNRQNFIDCIRKIDRIVSGIIKNEKIYKKVIRIEEKLCSNRINRN